MNRKIYSAIILIIVLLSVTACFAAPPSLKPSEPQPLSSPGSSSANWSASSDELSWKQDTSPFTFTQYFYGNWATHYRWKDQYVMRLITDKTGVHINRKLAEGSDDDYLNLMIATEDLPDSLMLDWNHPAVAKLIDQGLLYSMNELIDQYAPEFWDMLDPEMVQYHSIDGKLWYLPNFYEPKERLESGKPIVSIRPLFIRSDIYAALESPKIETTEDLKLVLQRIKLRFPQLQPLALDFFDVAKNGFAGSLSMDYFIYSFSPYLLEERIDDEQQKVLYPMRNEGFIDAFRYVNLLYREGLFDSRFLITKQEQYEDGMYRAEYAVASQFLNGMYASFNPTIAYKLGEDKIYELLDGLSADGKLPRYPASRLLGWQGLFITKKARDPQRIIRFAEYAWSDEGQMDARYGKQGETYELIDGLPQYMPEVRDLMVSDISAFRKKYGLDSSTLLWRAGSIWDTAELRDMILFRTDEYNAAMKLSRFNYDDYSLGMGNLEPDGSTPEGVINTKIKEVWNKAIPHLIMAASDAEFDKMYKEFIEQIDSIGAERAEKVMYARHLADLKKKGIQ